MKNILFILLLFCNVSYSQIVITNESSSTITTDATSYTIPVTYTNGDLFIVVVSSTFVLTPGTPTLSNSDFTYTSIGTTSNSNKRITAFTATVTNTGSTDITADFGVEIETSFSYYVFKVTGYNPSSIIGQFATGGTTGADPSISMSAISNPNNAVVVAISGDTNPLNGTATGGYTEQSDLGGINPTRGWYIMKDVQTTDNNPTVTAASSTWIGVAIEIKSAARRRINITKNNNNEKSFITNSFATNSGIVPAN